MIGTNTVNTRWSAKVEESARRRWKFLRNESDLFTNRIATSYRRFMKKGPQEPLRPRNEELPLDCALRSDSRIRIGQPGRRGEA